METSTSSNISGFLTPQEVWLIIETIPLVTLHPVRDQLLTETIWRTGARVVEACTLVPEHIGINSVMLLNEKQTRRVKVMGTWVREHNPKALKEVMVTSDFCAKLKQYCMDNRIGDGQWVFPANRDPSRPLSRFYVTRLITRASEAAGIYRFGKRHPRTGGRYKGAWVHLIRHASGSYLYDKSGGNIKLVQEQLGHSQISSTQMYTHITKKTIQEQVQSMDWTGGGK